MILVERHFHKGNEQIVRLCKLSKELYNRSNYLIRQAWFNKQKLPNISKLYNENKSLDCFKQFNNTKIAQQIIRKCLMDWNNFFKALKAYKNNKIKLYFYF